MTVSITKEQLIEKLENRIEITKNYPDLPEAQLDAVILKIALEALTAVPVAWRYRTKDKRVSSNWMLTDDEQRTRESACFESEPLYAAAPAQVADGEPVRYLNRFTGVCVTLDQQPNAVDDIAVYVPLYHHVQPAPVVINDEMAFAFHHAISDSALGADEAEEIKIGLRAAFANVAAPAMPRVPDEIEPDQDNAYDYVEGWNRCRAAMLKGVK